MPDTAMEYGFARAGILARDVRLEAALAEFLNHGGTIARMLEIVQGVAERMGSEGQSDIAREGRATSADAPRHKGDGEGHQSDALHGAGQQAPAPSPAERSEGQSHCAAPAVLPMPIAAPQHDAGHPTLAQRAVGAVPSVMSERNGAGHNFCADKAVKPAPRPVSPAYVAAAKAGAKIIAASLLNTFKVRDGRAIGDIPLGEIPILRAKNILEDRVLEAIERHTAYAPQSAKIRDVLSESDLAIILDRARGRNAA